jgi:hypothetical protein
VKKITLTIATLILFGSALAQAQTFGFASTGGALYCNYEQLTSYAGGYWAGVDNLSACGSSVDADIGGFTATVPNHGGAAHGAGVVYGDDIYTALYGGLVGQWTVFTKLKCNKVKGGVYVGPSGWVGVASISMFLGGVKAGPLSCAIPGKNGVVPTAGPSISAARRKYRRK